MSNAKNLVYETAIFWLWNIMASSSVQCPRIEAQIVVAADSPPVNARWTPDENTGSIWTSACQ
jgi:hypothetical protein